jgi:hypothetical protein
MSKPLFNITVNGNGLASFDFMEDLSAIQIVENTSLYSQRWYDLQGRQFSDRPLQKGLYILNGCKMVVK